MINPRTLLADIVAQLQSIPELSDVGIEAFDSESEIYRSNDEGINNMPGPVIVIWAGADAPRAGELQGWTHAIEIVIKPGEDVKGWDLVQSIVDGKYTDPEGSNCHSFIESEVPGCVPVADFSVGPVLDGDGNTYFKLSFTCTEQ